MPVHRIYGLEFATNHYGLNTGPVASVGWLWNCLICSCVACGSESLALHGVYGHGDPIVALKVAAATFCDLLISISIG